jgi:hypothetical protein
LRKNNPTTKLSSPKMPYLKPKFYAFGELWTNFEGCATVTLVRRRFYFVNPYFSLNSSTHE